MSTVLRDLKDGVLTVTLNRPERRNAWTGEMETALRAALTDATHNPEVRVVVLTGAGAAFCAGADAEFLRQLRSGAATLTEAEANPWPEARPEFKGKFAMPAALPKPVIAAINGPAVGIGYALALYSDIRLASESGAFIASFARMGLIAEKGIDWALAGIVGHGRAAELLLSGRKMGAAEALRIGLVTSVFRDDAFRAAVQDYAAEIAAKVSPRSAAVIKRQLQGLRFDPPAEILARGDRELAASLQSADFREAMAAMSERRPPVFPKP
ncbi:enoyl-CoA hydratase-related protein [Pararhodobacter zhoushanensis]|uniref:Enoyl-CoA hydratase-related protein n=1 Tax=Pararhodobacter zhoushanensis TaxID=2479545 RepID=A0ABT3H5M1_9RHOB|nr:enoyl-CoA hydratase-related protein [Pararhodobacter zhoushanensis]MCW1934995.1 enoyl-CoA hydratase-related protein [Pararhodobacter zhoushanensis]